MMPNAELVRRLAPTAVALLALAFVAAASARDPRAEKLHLNARDNRAARAALLTSADLSQAGQRVKGSGPDVVPSCPGYRPDFSKFTVTGKAAAQLQGHVGSNGHLLRRDLHEPGPGDRRLPARHEAAGAVLPRQHVRKGADWRPQRCTSRP